MQRPNSSDVFFISHLGNPISSSYLGKLMKHSLKRAVPGAIANPTRVRKMTSKLVAYETDEVKKQTAVLMAHSSAA